MKRIPLWMFVLAGLAIVTMLSPDLALAQFEGGDLQNKVNNVTSGLINFLLPAASVIGLVYAAILAATGDASARQRMVLIAMASLVGMLAPLIIKWLQAMTI